MIIFEPTGSYSALLKRFCADKSINTFIINPRQSANFAKALDNRSKSDIIDAKMLYKFHVMIDENDLAGPIINNAHEELSEILTYYKFLQKQRVGFSNHLEALSSKDGSNYIIKELKKEIKQLKSQEDNMIIKMKSLILSDEIMIQKFENITSIVGISFLYSFTNALLSNANPIFSINCFFQFCKFFGNISFLLAISFRVFSPSKTSNTNFALNSAGYTLRFLLI